MKISARIDAIKRIKNNAMKDKKRKMHRITPENPHNIFQYDKTLTKYYHISYQIHIRKFTFLEFFYIKVCFTVI